MNIALFAPAGSGKTTVLGLFAARGWTTINQDEIAHALLKENTQELVRIFGDGVLENSLVSRKNLGALVFADKNKRQALEDFLYPLIHRRTRALMKGDCLVEGANLYKVLKEYPFDKTLTITLPLPLLKERLRARGHSEVWIEAVLKAQKPLFAAQKKADLNLSNAGSLESLQTAVHQLILSLR